MKRKLIVGNWKMNGGLQQNRLWADQLRGRLAPAVCMIAICVPTPYLAQMAELLPGTGVDLGVQDLSASESGAYTGEVSAAMLKDFGVRYAIVGHSERRRLHAEDDSLVARKAERALSQGITPIVCLGESLEQRAAGLTDAVVKKQLAALVVHLGRCISEIVLAYEPIWAIGTGHTATPEQAQAVHGVLRTQLRAATTADQRVPIVYGGSMTPDNAPALLAMPDVDGGLVGAASLKSADFLRIIQAGSPPLA